VSETKESALVKRLEDVSMEAGGVRLRSIQDARTFCQLYHQSHLAPRSLDTPEKLFVALQTGAELGLRPGQALRAIDVIQNTPSIKPAACLGLIESSGVLHGAYTVGVEGEGDERRGVFWFRRKGWDLPQCTTFSVDEAKRAGLVQKGGGWKTYPDDMLQWRAVSRGVKRYFSDVVLGLEISEVVREYKPSGTPEVPSRTAPATPDPLLASVVDPEPDNPADEPDFPADVGYTDEMDVA
jgi:hypothetical protein